MLPSIFPPIAWAQSFPSKAVTIIVPMNAGGTPDTVIRIMQPKLTAALGVPVVIKNRSGAGGNIGGAAVAKPPPDGYAILVATINLLTMKKWIYKSMAFDPPALAPIARLGTPAPKVLLVESNSKIRSVKESLSID